MKIVIMTGGVVSSLGKGIAISAIGALLEEHGYVVKNLKLDPYLNLSSSLLNPTEHGEVFVCADGYESDLDLGHYERFTNQTVTRENNFTSGQAYMNVLDKEIQGKYLGETIQIIPHITDEIKNKIIECGKNSDVLLIELGGCAGDIESMPHLEALRQLKYDFGQDNVVYIHLALAPYLESSEETKTKPVQRSTKELRELGIQPDIIVVRTKYSLPESAKEKIGLFCDVGRDNVFEALDVSNIYEVPIMFANQYLDMEIINKLKLKPSRKNQNYLENWKVLNTKIEQIKEDKNNKKTIYIVGKYAELIDSYKSIYEALTHASYDTGIPIEIEIIDSENIEKSNKKDFEELMSKCDGILVPGGFGNRGTEGKIKTIKHARKSNIPFFGICLGMQLSVIEFARNVCKIDNPTSAEFNEEAENLIIDYMPNQKKIEKMNGTMRLGDYPCTLIDGSKIKEFYGSSDISERHRHRFEFNNQFKDVLEENGMVFSGINMENNLVEAIELPKLNFFIAVQYHPEFKSKPLSPHPLFINFIKSMNKNEE